MFFELGLPERILIRDNEFYLNLLKKYNGHKNLYQTVYNFTAEKENKVDPESLVFDKVFFDFDEDDCYTKIVTFHEYLRNKNIKHEVLLSGRGFHLIMYLKNGEKIKNKKQCLTNIHDYFNKKFSLNIDKQTIGDIMRLRRVPNTMNLKNKRYCIYLSGGDLSKGFDFIKKKAEEPNEEHTIFGRFFVDAEVFKDKDDITFNGIEMPKYDYKITEETEDKIFNSFPPCIKMWLTNSEHCKYINRYFFCLYCRDIGLPKEITFEIAKRYLTKIPDKDYGNKFKHFLKHKPLDYCYKRTEDSIPNCETHFKSGRCLGKCEMFKEKGFPLL